MYFLSYVNILLIKHTNVNSTSLYVYLKKAGLASRNIVHLQKNFTYVVSVFASIFLFLFVKPIRSLV